MNEFDLFRIFIQHLLEWRLEPRTVWSLIVPEDGHGYRRMLRAFKREARYGNFMNVLVQPQSHEDTKILK